MPGTYPYVYVNADGTARELHPGERAYLEAEYQGGGGRRPRSSCYGAHVII